MATNFEFYKNRLKAGFKREYVSKCFTEAIEETIEVKGHKRCGEGCGECVLNTIEWLLAEHIEQPKLTKRERAFCEAVQTGWIARDENKTLWWYCDEHEPVKDDDYWKRESKYVKNVKGCNEINNAWATFAFIKWEDEKPWAIEDLLKLDVMEVQHETD